MPRGSASQFIMLPSLIMRQVPENCAGGLKSYIRGAVV
jgi:hypothetical protein